jgi:hypothetical protein
MGGIADYLNDGCFRDYTSGVNDATATLETNRTTAKTCNN